MGQAASFEARLARVSDHLDQLASRATRAVAELRAQSKSMLDDLVVWRASLDEMRVDAEIARMDARDEIAGLRATLVERRAAIERRLEDARSESAAAWKALRAGMDEALHDIETIFEPKDAPRS